MAEIPAFYLVPQEQMEAIMAQLDRIESSLARRPPDKDAVLTAEEAAERMKVNTNTVYTWAREGRIGCVRAGRKVLFPESAIREFMEGGAL